MLGRIVGIAFSALGAGLFAWFVWAFSAAWQSRNWPSARGTVVASRLEREHDSEGDRFHARVKYTYVVDTIELKSSRVVFGDFLSSSEKTARKRVLQYPLGAEVQVFYDPRSPDESVLQPGCSTPLFAVGILGVIFLLVGSFAVLRPLAG